MRSIHDNNIYAYTVDNCTISATSDMEMIPAVNFLAWAATLGIVPDPVYSPPKCLVYEDASTQHRWWNVPGDAEGLHRFISHLITGIGPWEACFLWPRGIRWPYFDPPRNRIEAIRRTVIMGPAIPDGFEGAVKYTAEDSGLMVGRIAAHVMSGWCVQDDLFIVPKDGQHLLHTDHHGVVHASCMGSASMQRLIEHMASGGYNLPTELLDGTFKRPSWMA